MSRQAQWSWWKFCSTGSMRSSWGSWARKKLWSFLSLSLSLWRGSSGGERCLRETLFLSATLLKGGGSLVGVGPFSHVASDRIRNSLRLCQGMLRLNISKHFSTKRAVRHWNRLPGETVVSLLLQVSKSCVCIAQGHRVERWAWQWYVYCWT